MLKIFKFLHRFISFKDIHAPAMYVTAIAVAVTEIIIFMISTASLEFFLFEKKEGLEKLISFVHLDGHQNLSIVDILLIGVVLSIFSIYLNFTILWQIKNKLIRLGIDLQKNIISPYLGMEINFGFERNSKIDLKVFSESIMVIIETILLQLYLALSRVIIVVIYSAVGVLFIGWSFIFAVLILAAIFGFSLLIFSVRTKILTRNVNLLGERRLRILSNFVRGRLDIVLLGVPNGLIEKMDDVLNHLLNNKISITTKVHKPRIFIEGALIFILIGLGLLRVMHPDFELKSTHIIGMLIILRLLPAIHHFTSFLRSAASASWAIDDVNALLDKGLGEKVSDNQENHWSCSVQFSSEMECWISIRAENLLAEKPTVITLIPGAVNIIRGPSGVGKSTLLKAVIEALQDHEDWHTKLRHMTSFMPQDPITFLTCFKENLLMGKSGEADEKLSLQRELGFTPQWIKLFNESANQNDLIVSGGEAQRLAFLRCISDEERSIIFLDEPTSALDDQLEAKVVNYIEKLAEKGKFVVVVTHSDISVREKYKRVISL